MDSLLGDVERGRISDHKAQLDPNMLIFQSGTALATFSFYVYLFLHCGKGPQLIEVSVLSCIKVKINTPAQHAL